MLLVLLTYCKFVCFRHLFFTYFLKIQNQLFLSLEKGSCYLTGNIGKIYWQIVGKKKRERGYKNNNNEELLLHNCNYIRQNAHCKR